MDVLLVGAEKDRAKLRAILPDNLHIVAEAVSLDEARADDHHVDAWVFAPARRRLASENPPYETLTPREREVLALLAEGANNAQIARALGVSLKTVQNYVSRILDKLQVSDRTQAALKARGRPSSR